MIRSLRGTVLTHTPDATILEVSGVGYRVNTLPTLTVLSGDTLFLHTHFVVREDAHTLYGFTDIQELDMFELLLSIPKVGPKSALQFLKQATIPVLRKAIVREDATYLERLSGISKKNAEKIIMALKGKIDSFDLTTLDDDGDIDIRTEVAETLIALGYTPKDARDAARELPADISDIQTAMRITLVMLGKA